MNIKGKITPKNSKGKNNQVNPAGKSKRQTKL